MNRSAVRRVQALKAAGIEVEEGVCEQEARALNCGFFSVVQRGRPWVTMKVASSADGYIAAGEGQTTDITGAVARNHGHLLRSQHDAILTGIGTVLADDPALTCRLPGMEALSPVRVVLDRQGRIPKKATMLNDSGLEVWRYGAEKELPAILEDLAERGITRLMVEAGSRLNGAFLQQGLVDTLYWYQAPHEIGSGGVVMFGGDYGDPQGEELQTQPRKTCVLGEDQLAIYALADPQSLYNGA